MKYERENVDREIKLRKLREKVEQQSGEKVGRESKERKLRILLNSNENKKFRD